MFSEYLKPVRSFEITTDLEPTEIDTHGLLALVKVSKASVHLEAPEDDYLSDCFFISPGEFFRFNGKIKVRSMESQNGVVHIMLFDKE